MRTQTTVLLDDDERRLVAAASTHLGVAYDDAHDDDRPPTVRAVSHLGRGQEAASVAVLLRAREALAILYTTCEEQSALAYWTQMLHDPAPSEEKVPQGGGVPLVVDPDRACRYMAEARERQAQIASDALAVVSRALRLVPPDEVQEATADELARGGG